MTTPSSSSGPAAIAPISDSRNHTDVVWAEVVVKAHTSERFREALRGVWGFEKDGAVFEQFQALLRDIDQEPN